MAWWRTPSAQTPTWSLEDDHTAFVATLKAQIEQGVAPWQQSWKPGERRLPEHLVSGQAYRGVNSLYLSVVQTAKDYRDNRWATATQIQALGGHVRTGEKATPVLDPVAVLVRYYTPNVYTAVVAWYDVAPTSFFSAHPGSGSPGWASG